MVVLLLIMTDIAVLFAEIVLVHVCPKLEDPHDPAMANLETWENGLAWSSRGITIALIAHNLVLLYLLRIAFIRHFLYLFDLCVLVTALILSFIPVDDSTGIIIVLLCWRVFRIFEGYEMVIAESGEDEVKRVIRREKEEKDGCMLDAVGGDTDI
jgi:hypothetical protein